VKSTQKITKAMEMVAASKMRKSQDRMRAARPYAAKIRSVIAHLNEANPDYRHPFLVERSEIKAVGIIVLSTDRGLCGSLNVNVFKSILLAMREWQAKGVEVKLCVVGNKGLAFFRRVKVPILAEVSGLGDPPRLKDLIGPMKVMLDAYQAGEIDRLFVAHSTFVNTMTQKGGVEQVLPVQEEPDPGLQEHWDYIYEPDAAAILGGLLTRYVEAQVYRGVVETVASDNAGKIIDELQLVYNKVRQAAITKEISEIVGGAAAV
jgi:F-type H+-transporting ATPase subunit gamma